MPTDLPTPALEPQAATEAELLAQFVAGIRAAHPDLAAKVEALAVTHAEPPADTQKRQFVLRVIQPGLAGLMDGSVSTLAPLFAAAFATKDSLDTFLVGLAASLGAGISMGFAEALSDDGTLTGRGSPLSRGVVCGLMTTVGGLGHTLPYLIPDYRVATGLAIVVVLIELVVIAWVRHRMMGTDWARALLQVVLGGILVFLTGVIIGRAGVRE